MEIRRGDIFFVELGPTIGSEIDSKLRPVVVLAIPDIARKGLVVTIVPGTSSTRRFQNVVIVEPSQTNGLTNVTAFLAHQIRSLDQSRFRASKIGRLASVDIIAIEGAVKYCLGLGP